MTFQAKFPVTCDKKLLLLFFFCKFSSPITKVVTKLFWNYRVIEDLKNKSGKYIHVNVLIFDYIMKQLDTIEQFFCIKYILF